MWESALSGSNAWFSAGNRSIFPFWQLSHLLSKRRPLSPVGGKINSFFLLLFVFDQSLVLASAVIGESPIKRGNGPRGLLCIVCVCVCVFRASCPALCQIISSYGTSLRLEGLSFSVLICWTSVTTRFFCEQVLPELVPNIFSLFTVCHCKTKTWAFFRYNSTTLL